MNKVLQSLRNGITQRLVIGNGKALNVAPKSSAQVNIPISTNKMLLKSIEVECSKNLEFRVEFFEEPVMKNSRYNSGNVTKENYDVLDLPYVDHEETKTMYFLIHNLSDYEADYTIEARGIPMK